MRGRLQFHINFMLIKYRSYRNVPYAQSFYGFHIFFILLIYEYVTASQPTLR